jgi:RNA polymerase sigma factor (sigma-70 family)
MDLQFNSDLERIAALRGDDAAAHLAIFNALSTTSTLTADAYQGVPAEFIQKTAFESLKKAVRGGDAHVKAGLLVFFDRIARNLVSARLILSPDKVVHNRELKKLYTDATVNNWVRGQISGNPKLDRFEVIHEGIMRLFKSLMNEKFEGLSELPSYLISFCGFVIRESYSEGKIKNKDAGEGDPKKISKTDNLDDYHPSDFTADEKSPLEMVEREELAVIVKQVLEDPNMAGCKDTLVMYHYEEKERAEIGEILNMNKQSVSNKVGRCHDTMRKILETMPEMAEYIKIFIKKFSKNG